MSAFEDAEAKRLAGNIARATAVAIAGHRSLASTGQRPVGLLAGRLLVHEERSITVQPDFRPLLV